MMKETRSAKDKAVLLGGDSNPNPSHQLVDAPKLLELIFPPECRPTVRWVRERQRKREIPFVRLGRLVFFDVERVRESLTNHPTNAARA